jgi:hypothetical protein
MKNKLILIFIFFIINCFCAFSQFKAGAFVGGGTNPLDNPLFLSSGVYAYAKHHGFSADYAIDINITNRDVRAFNAIKTSLNYENELKNSSYKIGLVYLFRPSTELVSEHNMALQVDYQIKNWEFRLGNNFRAFKFKTGTVEYIGSDENTTLWESPNLMYLIRYYISTNQKTLGGYVSITNFDWFIIEQETNPFVNIGAYYKLQDAGLNIFVDYNYQTAGFNNIRVNYFGMFFRTGVIWEIE